MYQICLRSNSQNAIVLYTNFLSLIFKKLNITFFVFTFPTTIKRITLFKSPHVNKKAKEHFEIRNYKMTINFEFSGNITIFQYLLMNKPKSIVLKFIF
jgi:ribosomal protein S10